MNKKAILLIIILMSIALVGIVIMQAYWINYAMRLNEAQFDKNVRVAIDNVKSTLEKEEISNYALSEFFPTNPMGNAVSEDDLFSIISADEQEENSSVFGEMPMDSFPPMKVDVSVAQGSILGGSSRFYRQLTDIYASLTLSNLSLRERLDPVKLNNLLEEELRGKGIKLDYQFGVFDNQMRKFIVSKSLGDTYPKRFDIDQASMLDMFQSPFWVNLFQIYTPGFATTASAGRLFINFPSKNNYILGSVWSMLMAMVLFTGIILFCFIYTMQVIFQQKKLSEIKNDFLNNMTHEFKTPIATISLAADSITSPMVAGNSDKVKRFAGIIKQENKRMNNQVERVLQMALIDKKDFRMSIESLNVNDIVANAVRPFTLQVEKREGTIAQKLSCENPVIQADKTHLTNVVQNLLDNANKYSPESPEIVISTKDIKGGVEITVKDHGLGMSREDRKQIFNKFFRVHTGNRHDVKGFGLGLSYVKAIVEAHGGHISVKSELGKGSEFILFFPTFSPAN